MIIKWCPAGPGTKILASRNKSGKYFSVSVFREPSMIQKFAAEKLLNQYKTRYTETLYRKNSARRFRADLQIIVLEPIKFKAFQIQ